MGGESSLAEAFAESCGLPGKSLRSRATRAGIVLALTCRAEGHDRKLRFGGVTSAPVQSSPDLMQ